MIQIAKVTKVLTKGFVRVTYLKESASQCGSNCRICKEISCLPLQNASEVAFARDFYEAQIGDIVTISPTLGVVDPISKFVYIMPVIMFIFGYLIGQIKGWDINDKIIAGAIMSLITLGISWMMNRKSRLTSNTKFKITKILRNSLED